MNDFHYASEKVKFRIDRIMKVDILILKTKYYTIKVTRERVQISVIAIDTLVL